MHLKYSLLASFLKILKFSKSVSRKGFSTCRNLHFVIPSLDVLQKSRPSNRSLERLILSLEIAFKQTWSLPLSQIQLNLSKMSADPRLLVHPVKFSDSWQHRFNTAAESEQTFYLLVQRIKPSGYIDLSHVSFNQSGDFYIIVGVNVQ